MAKRIGLFGGTFDPVHNGHISIARSFLKSSKIDELWVLLTPFPPHKRKENHVSYQLRYQMLELAFSGIENTQILTIENELPKPSYSVNTIRYLKDQHPDLEFFFCMGEDNLAKFHTWRHHEEILDELMLLVANRPGADHSQVKNYILEKTIFVDHTPVEISSSKIKEHIFQKELLKELLPKKVLDIIVKEELYINNF